MSEEQRAKISAKAVKRYEDPEAREKQRVIQKAKPTAHGMVGSGVYTSWYAMKRRVLNPNNKYFYLYGGRGVTICPRWMDFKNFYADMGDRPEGLTLERIDPEGNYEPGNCKWATWSEQRRNQRRMHGPRI